MESEVSPLYVSYYTYELHRHQPNFLKIVESA